jgi:hypothetical protein
MKVESHYFGGKIESIRIVQDDNVAMNDDRITFQHLLLAKAAAKNEEYDTEDEKFRNLTSSWIKRHAPRSSTPATFKLTYHVRSGGSWTFDHRKSGQQLYLLEAETIQGQRLEWEICGRESDKDRRTICHLAYQVDSFVVSDTMISSVILCAEPTSAMSVANPKSSTFSPNSTRSPTTPRLWHSNTWQWHRNPPLRSTSDSLIRRMFGRP